MPRRKDNEAYRLAKVTLVHRSGKIKKINARDYGDSRVMDWHIARGWRLKTEQRGGASEDTEQFAHDQNMINWEWSENPKEQRWRGDKRRAYEQRAMKGSVSTEDNYADAQAEPQEAEAEKAEVDTETILAKPWFTAASEVQRITGTRPSNKQHARELLDAHIT